MPITTEARLREIYGEAHPRAAAKVIGRLDAHCRAFVAASPFVVVATSDGTRLDASPKGDRPGFVQVEGERALLIPDWPGNSRIDGLRNILVHPRAGLIFLIPGVRETLRVNGPATIHDESAMRARFARDGRLPLTVLRVEAEEVFLHCAKAFLRSALWDPASWPAARPVPTMAEMLRDHCDLEGEPEPEEAMLARYRAALY
ncbi:pyridoxamine 5'-phosphate oxidase family protein [Limibaculum sp. FT325]|uniref:pyridoxamine 5'-phosphate oxidase family protein n=1 Tax=Thermohalobaculum sediminis TaxID=2939436 RepID=UPI0020BFCDB1|nr:pyridoxamine 5'-phosphate oxidase family protein [Limibaculum sediminis]MCL5776709.1 pyridoxamine 5'-phosphate oxidase family protein [Limibaculum sediminis]